MKKIATLILFAGLALSAMAQNLTLKGTVKDSAGEPIIGAFVVQQGTNNGAMTDVDGAFALTTPQGASIEISCIGYATQVISNNGQQDLSIVLADDAQMLEETVVIGYGVQKKSVVTAAIAKVDAEALGVTAPTRVDNALKGLTAGVTVTSASGQPGASSRIRIRGVGSINSSDPIYIVDGMPISGGIDYLNPSDIESIEVLKDAASGAVYGTRAANGVVLVTTKKGAKGRTHVDYNFTFGISNPWKQREVLNASEYALMINEGLINAGMAPKYADPFSYGVGTNWQKEVFNRNAPQQTHEVSVSGASDRVNYYLALGYTDQQGIVGGNWGRSNYNRLTLRSNTSFTLVDKKSERNYLNSIVLQNQLSYAKISSKGISENSQWGSPLGSALAMSPILGVYASDEDVANYRTIYPGETLLQAADGRYYMIPGGAYNEMNNPIADLSRPANDNWSHKFVGGLSGDIQIWDNIHFHTSFSVDMSFWGNYGYTPTYYLSGNNHATTTEVNAQYEKGLVWQVENYLTYNKEIGKHAFSVIIGQSAFENTSDGLWGNRRDLAPEWYDKPYIGNAPDNNDDPDKQHANGWFNSPYRLASYFGRADYNYGERYMVQFTIRQDGSSKFGSNNKWGYFPAVSAGWTISEEKFFQPLKKYIGMLKFRYSYGEVGDDYINSRWLYATQWAYGGNIQQGLQTETSPYTWYKESSVGNPDVHWEKAIKQNLGIDYSLLDGLFAGSIEIFHEKRSDILIAGANRSIPSYYGATPATANLGRVRTKGYELELRVNKVLHNGMRFWGNFNMTHAENKILEYDDAPGLPDYQKQTGFAIGQDHANLTSGYANTWDQVIGMTDFNTNDDQKLPGSYIIHDYNGDGVIDSNDSAPYSLTGTPQNTYSASIGWEWKGFSVYMQFYGVRNVVRYVAFNSLPGGKLDTVYDEGSYWTVDNMDADAPMPRWGSKPDYYEGTRFHYDGSFIRLKNAEIAYTFTQPWVKKMGAQSLKVFLNGNNLWVWSRMPDDRESNFAGTGLASQGAYPTVKRFNLGLKINL